MPNPDDEYEHFIAICLEQNLLSQGDASTLRQTVLNQGGWIGQTALQKGFLSATDLDIAQSLQYPTRVVQGYEILSLVGRGGMGVVYRAKQIDLDRTVALKTILASQISNPAVAPRFEREAKALARLQHPNIVQALNFGRYEGRYHFAMEFINGRTCEQALTQQGRLPLEHVWSIVRQVASGLLHALNHDLIHRDIKPANLILLPPPEGTFLSNGAEMVKITDFGLAIFADPDVQKMKLTTSDKLAGSPAYMSPEQFAGESVDFKTDLYALGATAWHLIFGTMPFQGKSITQLIHEKTNPKPIDRTALSVAIPEEQLVLLLQMLDPNPQRRPESYEMLIDRVDKFKHFETMITASALPPKVQPADVAGRSSTTSVADSRSHALTQTLAATSLASQTDPSEPEQIPSPEPIINPAFKLATKLAGKLAGKLAKRWTVAILAVIVVGIWSFYAWFYTKTQRGPRIYTRTVASTPLFDGETLSGWAVGGSMIGAWKTLEDPDRSTAIASTSRRSAISRELPSIKHPRITLFVWPNVHPGTVDIDFAVDSSDRSDVRGCLRFTESGVVLGTKTSDFGELKTIPLLSKPKYHDDRYMVVDIEKQVDDWYLFLEEKLIGTLTFDRVGDAGSLRLVINAMDAKGQPPFAYFSDASIKNLVQP